jgi:hypothetical protein
MLGNVFVVAYLLPFNDHEDHHIHSTWHTIGYTQIPSQLCLWRWGAVSKRSALLVS